MNGNNENDNNQKWYEIFKEILPNEFIKEIMAFLKASKQDNDEFLKRQTYKLELYMNQLASNLITKEQFEGYVKDIQALTEMQRLKMQVAVKARAQHLIESIADLILKRLLSLI